jgi:hypothetical protein
VFNEDTAYDDRYYECGMLSNNIIRYTDGGKDPLIDEQLFYDFIEICASYTAGGKDAVEDKIIHSLARFMTISPLADSDTLQILGEWLDEKYGDLIKVHKQGRILIISNKNSSFTYIEDRGKADVLVRISCDSRIWPIRVDLYDPNSLHEIEGLIGKYLDGDLPSKNKRKGKGEPSRYL